MKTADQSGCLWPEVWGDSDKWGAKGFLDELESQMFLCAYEKSPWRRIEVVYVCLKGHRTGSLCSISGSVVYCILTSQSCCNLSYSFAVVSGEAWLGDTSEEA